MRIAVCDDEKVFRKILSEKITSYSENLGLDFIIYEFSDGNELLSAEMDFDIIFMDYQMKECNGLDAVAELRNRRDNTMVIFVSSFAEIVFESMKVKTFRFLVKPVSDDKLCEALTSCIKEIKTDDYIILNDPRYALKRRISEKDMIYCEADNFYSKVRTSEGEFQYLGTLSELENELRSNCFYRTHRSYIVNFRFITTYNNREILFENGEKASIAKKKFTDFQKAYIAYIRSGGRR